MHSDSLSPIPAKVARPLRILHLEDSAMDREIVRQTLAEMAECEIVYAASRAEFEAALAEGRFDLILSDYSLPGYDGEAALALAREKCADVPYLFVSGTIGEERAIESLKSGATDYVLKMHLERLLPAVRRALREAAERSRRRAAEKALREAEARFRGIFENAVEGIYQAAPDGRLLQANWAMARLCGYGSPEAMCAAVTDLGRDLYVEPERRAEFVRLLDGRGEVLGHEWRLRRKDGTVAWVAENARAVRAAAGELLYYEGMATDVTARRQAEEALRESEERFREMAGRVDDVFWIATGDGAQWLYVSPAYEGMWGRPVAALHEQPQQWFNAILPDDRAKVLAAYERLARGEECRVEYRIGRPDGTIRWVDHRGYPTRDVAAETRRTVGVVTDITVRKQLEAQLLHAQKMEAVGQLAGGVAHDFNNILTVITGYSRLLLDTGGLPAVAIEPLTQIYTAGTRAANLTRQLLVFSRKQTADRRVVDLNRIVGDMAKMLHRLIGEHIALEVALPSVPALVEADPGMMEQVLMNLAVNARDAMPDGGKLSIAIESVTIADPSLRHPAARPGEFVSVTVSDTGCGIPAENLQRIFEPFFTTKAVGEGTGLGLATVFGIAQQHHGWIEVESAVGAGTRFRVLLPATAQALAEPVQRPGKSAPVSGGGETLLLVEDEPTVREFAVAVLRSHGYRVLQACNGVEALEVWKWHQARIALLVSDLVMPEGLGGVELADLLRRDKPTLRVLLTSGYAFESIGATFRPPPGTHFLHKPYKPQELAQTVRAALDGVFNR